jgi:hypothetical protein
MARHGGFSDHAHVAALDRNGHAARRSAGPHDLTQSLHHGAHNNQSYIAVPIVLSAVMPTQNGSRATAVGSYRDAVLQMLRGQPGWLLI